MMSKSKLKTSDNISSSICNIITPKCYFSILPNEILKMIFNYLNPVTLVALKELGMKRVTAVSLSFRCADFSQCNTVHTETLLAFFTSDRINIIQEINFDGLFFVKSEDLEKCIVQCKNLTVLSVVECGVTFKNVFRILASCPLLKELYWSVNSKGYSHKCNTQFFCLEKIYFYAQLDVNFDNEVIKTILQICPNANDVCLNLSSYYTKTFPPYIARNAFTGRILHEGRKEPLCVCLAVPGTISKSSAKHVMVQLYLKTKPRTLTFMEFRDGEDKLYFLTNFSSFLQIYTKEKHLNNILMLPDESVHSLNLFLTEDPEFLTLNHIEKIKKVTGNRLRQMTLHDISKSITPLEFRKNTGIIKQITSYSQNIAVLNLSESHFDDNFPFPTLYCLKGLKVLSLPSCILKVDTDFEMTDNQDFERMIDKCPNVENFGFHGCLLCIFGPDDDGLAPIYKWKKLKHLTLSKIVSFQVCPFLKNVAYHCPDLTTLELMELGGPLVCHYMPMAMYIIRQSKKLKFLRLNQTCMNPNISVFWKAIESAVNLQGLCISTTSNAHIINKIVTDALKKLPFLHVFHLAARHMCQNLKSQVKQIMNKKEIQVSNVVILESIRSVAGVRHCGLVHFTLDDVIAY